MIAFICGFWRGNFACGEYLFGDDETKMCELRAVGVIKGMFVFEQDAMDFAKQIKGDVYRLELNK